MRGDSNDVLALPATPVTEVVLLPVVVVVAVEEELPRRVVELPARERPCALPDVLLGVVADAHGEALHELPGEVLVGVGLVVRAGVEPDQHRRVPRHRLGEGLEGAGTELSEELVLVVHEVGGVDLRVRGGELVVQEEDELLPQRRVAHDHPVEPPGGQLHELVVVVVLEPRDGGLREGREIGELERVAGPVLLGQASEELVDCG